MTQNSCIGKLVLCSFNCSIFKVECNCRLLKGKGDVMITQMFAPERTVHVVVRSCQILRNTGVDF
jgi:hypothetical protein